MSASMVRKSLAIVDADFGCSKGNKGKGKKKTIGNLIPENHKIIKKFNKKGHKEKVELLKTESKITVAEARKTCKSKEEILKDNLKKLELIKQGCLIELDEGIADQITERAVTRRPIKIKKKSKKDQATAFTEEDFQKFEAEYIDE